MIFVALCLAAAPALVKLDPPAVDDDEARARVGAHFVRRSVLGWVVVDDDVWVRGAVPVRRGHTLASTDPLRAQQAGLDAIHVDGAWARTVGGAQRVGVVDTGLERNHEEMHGKDAGGFDFISDAATAADGDGRDADYTDSAPAGTLFHGSHVSGIIAAAGDNGVGMAGIDWRAVVVTVRALSGTDGGSSIDIMEGALWLAGGSVDGVPSIDQPVDVINLSLGFAGPCDTFTQDIVNQILSANISMVAATGNHGADFGGSTDATVLSPANCKGVVAVGAVDFDLRETDYTNTEGGLDIVAPGGTHDFGVISLGAGPDQYVFQQGTSMAAPHVTGVIALMLQQDPTLTPEGVKQVLFALPSTCSGCNGLPMLDAERALKSVAEGGGHTDVTQSGGCASTSSSMSALGVLAFALFAARRRTGCSRISRST